MTVLKFSWLASAMLVFAPAAAAKAPQAATPVGSPGAWIGTSDYPAPALRLQMTGTTVFRLALDAVGTPGECTIVESSGFDLLDAKTCERLMLKARFSPARDRSGKAVASTYTNRVRWVVPESARAPVMERFASMTLAIDEAGKVTSCRMALHLPVEAASEGGACGSEVTAIDPQLALEFRKTAKGSSAEVEVRYADVFTEAQRARVLAPVPGTEQRGLSVHEFGVASNGKVANCRYTEQRGSPHFAQDFCAEATKTTFDPPFSAYKDGVAGGWHLMRVLLKTGS